jgi:hypothetical protein
VATDSSGNVYAAGNTTGTDTYGFGNSVTATGTAASGQSNTLLVKYNSSGIAQWAQTLTAGTAGAAFSGIAIDNAGNVYAAGVTYGIGTFGFGNAVTATGTDTSGSGNTLVVKYNSNGAAQWAQTLTAGTAGATFRRVTTDNAGNIYAVGTFLGTGTFGFGNSVIATGVSSSSNTLVVKYNSAGAAQWAQTLTAGTGGQFYGVATDSSGNIYAVGLLGGSGTTGFGNSVTATGISGINNTLVVKYNSSGVAQWAQTLTAGTALAQFDGVALDSSGNVYAAGFTNGTGTFGFGNSVTAAGTDASNNGNTIVVKYNSSGVAQWAKTLTAGTAGAWFNSITTDSAGNLYAVGGVDSGTYNFGNSVTATGTDTSGNGNSIVVKYNSGGAAQWAKTLTAGTAGATFSGVTIDGANNVYAVGVAVGTGTYGFGNSVTATGTDTSGTGNTLLVKYH